MVDSSTKYDAIVLGGGAAGLMCALTAGQRGRRVLLIEHNDAVGKKIRISGGGRCNFTNLHVEPSCFHSQNPRFCYSALAGYSPEDFVAYVESHQIDYHERKHRQLFCLDSAQQIIDALLDDCETAGVEIRVECSVLDVTKPANYTVQTTHGEFQSPTLVVATGGLSIPKLGASDFGYQLAKQFDMPIVPCKPGLVPLTLNDDEQIQLPGASFNARVTTDSITFEENILFTHRGLSGPAILQASSYWEPKTSISIDLFPEDALEEILLQQKLDDPKSQPRAFLKEALTERFAKTLCEINYWNKPFGEMPDKRIREMAAALQHWQLSPTGTEGYGKAEVTCGGVDTRALSPRTMESRNVSGLFFIGEVMDVTGWLGGYNFQWAWASAVAAGRAI